MLSLVHAAPFSVERKFAALHLNETCFPGLFRIEILYFVFLFCYSILSANEMMHAILIDNAR